MTGLDGNTLTAVVEAYDLSADTWTTLQSPLPTGLAGSIPMYYLGYFALVGGRNSIGVDTIKILAFIPAMDGFLEVGIVANGMSFGAHVFYNRP